MTAFTNHITIGTVMTNTPMISITMPDFIIFVIGTMPEA